MTLRILSGMVFIPRGGTQSGSVEISFEPFALANSSNTAFELRKRRRIGPGGRFAAIPASIVGARQFGILTILGDGGYYRINIDDRVTRDSITIRWKRRKGRVDQEEIGFMIVGDVPGPVTLPPRPTTPVRPTDKLTSIAAGRKGARKRPAAKKKRA
jgi:hypothetical protein